jgi:hypothetical protein
MCINISPTQFESIETQRWLPSATLAQPEAYGSQTTFEAREPAMTITIGKLQLAVAVLAVVMVTPAAALATDVFDDVADGRFFTVAVQWAADNGVTIGTGPTTFEADRGVTRGESVTFLHRYDTNIVQPAIAGLSAQTSEIASEVDNSAARVAASASGVVDNWDGTLLAEHTIITAPSAGFLVITYTVNLMLDPDETGTGVDFYNADVWVDDSAASFQSSQTMNFDLAGDINNTVVVQTVFPVADGQHLVSGFIDRLGGASASNLAFVTNMALIVLFVPLDGAGAVPVGIAVPDRGDSQEDQDRGETDADAARRAAMVDDSAGLPAVSPS